MKILLISRTPQHGFLLQRLKDEGNEVRFLLPRDADNREYENLLDKVYTPREAFDWGPELVFLDGPGFGPLIKQIPPGVMVVNGGILHDSFAADHAFSLSIAARAGIPTVATKFSSDAGEMAHWLFCEEKDGAKRWSYDGKTYESSEDLLQSVSEFTSSRPVQEEYPGSVYTFAGMYSGKYFCGPPLHLFGEHGLLPVGGLRTPEACTLSVCPRSKVWDIFEKMERAFAALRYVGWVFVQIKMRPGGVAMAVKDIQVTPPPGFWAAWLGGVKSNVGELLRRLAKEKRFRYSFSEGYTAAVKLSLPPYPFAGMPGISGKSVENTVIPIPNGSERTLLWQQARRNGTADHLLATGPELGYAVVNSKEISQIHMDLERECGLLRAALPTLQHKSNVGDFLELEIASLKALETGDDSRCLSLDSRE